MEFANGLEDYTPPNLKELLPRATDAELNNPALRNSGQEFRAMILSLIPQPSKLLTSERFDDLKRFIRIILVDTTQVAASHDAE